MDKVSGKLTVFFEEPFWVGVFERVEKGKLSVCRVVFGAEPKSYDVYDFVLKNYDQLRFSPAVEAAFQKDSINPKRAQRQIHRQVQNQGIGTKSQQALKLQQERMKTERKAESRKRKMVEKKRQFALKQQKKKEKHRGR